MKKYGKPGSVKLNMIDGAAWFCENSSGFFCTPVEKKCIGFSLKWPYGEANIYKVHSIEWIEIK